MTTLPSFQKVACALALWALAAGLACAKKSVPASPAAGTTAATGAGGSGQDAAAIVADGGGLALGASFDCKKAATKIERLICASPELSRLDGEVAAAFRQALGRYRDPKVLRSLQRSWLLDTRNQAAGEAPLQEAYTARLKELRDDIEDGKEVVRGELAWRMMVLGKTKEIVLPVITRWRNAKAKARINAALVKAASQMGCEGEPREGGDPFEYSMGAGVTYAKNDIFSVEIHSAWFCGGAHGTHDQNSSMTFDLRTGAEVGFADLFANYERDNDALLRVVFGEEVAKAEGDDVLTLAMIVEHPVAFSFHENGLRVQPVFPLAIEALAEGSTAPYADLERFAARKGVLARIKD